MATLLSMLILILLCGFVLASTPPYQIIDMTDMCDKTVNLTFAQLLIGRVLEDTPMPNSECKIHVRVQPEHQMIISLQSIGDSVSGIICGGKNISMLDIPDSDPHYILPLSEREFCKEITTDNDLVSTSEEVTINFYNNFGNNTDIRAAFQFLLIPFHSGICDWFEEKCSNNRCIESSMACMENYNNCSSGDCRINDSYIFTCFGGSPRSNAIVITIIVLTILIVVCLCCCCLWRRRRQRLQKLRKNTKVVEAKESPSATTEPPFISVTSAPAYTPPYAPPAYSTLPRKHPEVADSNKGKLEEMFKEGKENTAYNDEISPP